MGTETGTEPWTEPLAVVVGSVQWRCVALGRGDGGEERFGATSHSGRSAQGALADRGGPTLEERLAAGLRRVQEMSWVDPDDGVGYAFRMEPGTPPRVGVSNMEGGIHVVPLPPGRFLTGLGDKSLAVLVQQARDRQDEAKWASEGGAVADPPGDHAAPEV